MKRMLIGVGVVALSVLGLAAPASAADQATSRQTVAEADWLVQSATRVTYTSIGVMNTDGVRELKVELLKASVDADGTIVGGTRTDVDVTRGFAFTIDAVGLTSARTSGSALPATTCAIDVNADPIPPCRATKVDLSASWTGQGPVNHTLVIERHWVPGGPVTVIRTSSINRDASATGYVGTVRLRASDLGSALLGKTVVTKSVQG